MVVGGRIEEDEEHADIEGSSIESRSVLENLGAELTIIDLDWSPEDEDPKKLEGIDLIRLLLHTLMTSSTLDARGVRHKCQVIQSD